MPPKKKTIRKVREPVWIDGKNPEVRIAWKEFERGSRDPLLSILRRELYRLNYPELQEVILQLAAQASIPIKRKPGRPKGTCNLTDAERGEVERDIRWLLKIKPNMSKEHIYRLLASRYPAGERTIKQYWLDANTK